MKNNYLIYTDSAADLPAHVFEKYDLRIIPMDYSIDGVSYSFDTGVTDHDKECDKFYQAIKDGADVKTTQITPYQYIDTLGPVLEAGNDILYLCFSSGMSGTYNNACSAAEQLKEDYPDRKLIVIDTKAATMGQGVICRVALLNRKKGMSIEENAEWLEAHRPYLCHRFLVGDLDHLHKGGRISSVVAVVGGMLKIKPLLIIDDDGKLQIVGKARGMKIALKRILTDYMSEHYTEDNPKIIHVGHTSLYEEAEALKEQLKPLVDEDTIIETVNMGPIVGAHCGSELISICGWNLHRKASSEKE